MPGESMGSCSPYLHRASCKEGFCIPGSGRLPRGASAGGGGWLGGRCPTKQLPGTVHPWVAGSQSSRAVRWGGLCQAGWHRPGGAA